MRFVSKMVLGLMATTALAGCSAVDRIKDIDGGPKIAPIAGPVAQTVTNVPMPPAPTEPRGNSSLWQAGARSFFHDPRASRVGDIITVNVSVADAAKFSNTTQRSRTNADDANLTNFFGLEKSLAAAGMDPANLIKMGSDTSNVGAGGIDRSESVNLTLAALVTQVLPNGNMVIGGHQQMKVNNELRDLEVTGIVRTEDITSANTIDLSQIAEARITYGGKGTVTDVQTPRYGSQLLDILMPW
ncbi:MAG TPA: flagellar basal body L-ring protein FlgH [Rhizomicrobium sp.]|nr:flagellar basal body L-ring protein FlgH [Rhizomicrobium sp.]